ncbi:Hypothetical_protein [Hexamita inflata]|uniref:Hypothetical_protein n=1 Tax=Hexamita inflata TaxID=28002 RepID=A0AA86PGJ8_9EUKA|nr:Hypothetical protein HINF_LOCUS25496 [Hexamita inflata]
MKYEKQVEAQIQLNLRARSYLYTCVIIIQQPPPDSIQNRLDDMSKNRLPIAVKRSKKWNNTPNPTQPSLPPRQRTYSLQIMTVTRSAASVQIRISQLSALTNIFTADLIV